MEKEFHNKVLSRREIVFEKQADKTPSYTEVEVIIAEKYGVNAEAVMVEGVKGGFGKNNFVIKASIYDSKDLKDEAVKRLIKPKKTAAGA